MTEQDRTTTKEKIMRVAAKMFSERGYDKVTMREIATAVGINSASIYHHFPSKDAILKSLYGFYSEALREKNPDLGELLPLVETVPPHEVLMKTEFHFSEEMRQMLDQILVTASREICTDMESEMFIRKNIFDNVENILRPLLQRMMELGKIEPLDLDNFLRVLTYFCFSAAVLNNSAFKIGVAEYQAGLACIFSMIRVV